MGSPSPCRSLAERRALFDQVQSLPRILSWRMVRSWPALRPWREELQQDASMELWRATLHWKADAGTTWASWAFGSVLQRLWRRSKIYGRPRGYRSKNGPTPEVVSTEKELIEGVTVGGTLEAILPLPDDAIDQGALGRRVAGEVAAVMARERHRKRGRPPTKRWAPHVHVFLATEFGEATESELAQERGVSRQRVHQMAEAVRPYFDAWAAGVRAEGSRAGGTP